MKDEFKTDVFSLNENGVESENNAPHESSVMETQNETNVVNDEFVIGSGFVLPEEQKEPEIIKKPKKNRSRGVIRSLLWIVFILVSSAVLAVTAIFGVIDYMGLYASKTITIDISEDKSVDEIATELHEEGAVRFPWLFSIYCKSKGYDEKFTVGAHTIRTDMGYATIVNEFAYVEGYDIKTVTITIPEMATVDDIAELLEKESVCTKAQFMDALYNSDFDYDFLKGIPLKSVHYRLEGYLFPDTYEFYVWNSKEGAEFAINKMLQNFQDKFNSEYREKAEKMGYTIHEITTMASIIEMECSGYSDEMSKVSAVFYNRLNHWGDQPKTLGSSPTAEYPYGSGNYDTNKIEGLPPGPLCSPSENAIKAALNPKKSYEKVYFYFVTDTKGNFYYTKTLDEHNSTIYSLTMQGIWGED